MSPTWSVIPAATSPSALKTIVHGRPLQQVPFGPLCVWSHIVVWRAGLGASGCAAPTAGRTSPFAHLRYTVPEMGHNE